MNFLHECAVFDVPQSKSSKTKIAVFVAGKTRHLCWFTALATHLAHNEFAPTYNTQTDDEDDEDERHVVNYLIPELQSTNTPSTKIGSFLKAIFPYAYPPP